MELIERGAYLAALGEHLGSAVAGHGRLVLVGGDFFAWNPAVQLLVS